MSSVPSAAGPIHLGIDTSKNTIVVGILMPGAELPVLDRIWNEEGSVRHLIGRLGDPAALRACYEAGPCGFELHRLLASMGVACAELDAIEAELSPWASREPLAPAVARLGCYRGIAELTGLVLAAEVVD
jgi:hypothetical protein